MPEVFVLGGFQTDFALHWSREGKGVFEIMQATVEGALAATQLEPREVQVAHVANFTGELFNQQGQLGGLFAALHPDLDGVPASRHEAACASGGVALLAASADVEAGRYELACVLGVEQERNVPGAVAAQHLGVAAWSGREAQQAKYPWPYLFDRLAGEYESRFSLDHRHLAAIARQNYDNARRNPQAQARAWTFGPSAFAEDEAENPVVEGRIRRRDSSQITDGGAAVLLASRSFAERWARRRGLALERVPRLLGWGHRTSTMLFDDKMARSRGGPFVFPQLRAAITDAFRRAAVPDVYALSGLEVHDCFTITEYMAIDHFGITAPGRSFEAIEDGRLGPGGRLPVNPSGGLIGGGHPVGASGVRMALDAWKQVTGDAGDYQVPGATRFGTLNIGGTATTSVVTVIGVDG